MRTNARPLWRTVSLAILLTACSAKGDHQVLRHLVTAELIEREQVTESHVLIEEIRIEDQRAVVRVTVRGRGGRMGRVESYRCEFRREAGRWVLRSAQAD